MQVSDIIKVVSADTFERPIYAGNAIQTVRAKDAKKVITVRTTAFAAAPEGGSAAVESIPAPAAVGISTFEKAELSKSDRPELTSAKIIISGGRGMGNGENFTKYIEPIADKLGAAMGASRAPRSTRAMRRTTCRSAKPARSSPPSSIHRRRHFRRDPASRRHEGLEDHRRDQQGRRSADLPGRRLRPRRRSLQGDARASTNCQAASQKPSPPQG